MVSSPFPRFNPQTGQLEMIDPTSGQAIPNYNIVPSWQQVKLEDYGLGLGQTPQDSPITPDTPEQAVSEQREQQGFTRNLEGGDRGNNTNSGNYHRDQSNNYGYFDKPTGMGFVSNIPGPLGLVGKGVNAVVNANNVGAVNAARQDIGVDKLGLKGTIGGTLKDRQGFVANVDYQDKFGVTPSMPVSLEPVQNKSLSPDMITGLPGTVSLSQNQKDPNRTGLFSGVKSFIDNLFSSPENTKQVESKAFGTMTVAAPKSGGVYDVFPDAPAAPKDTTPSRSQSESRGGLSDAARDAVDKGTGGLY